MYKCCLSKWITWIVHKYKKFIGHVRPYKCKQFKNYYISELFGSRRSSRFVTLWDLRRYEVETINSSKQFQALEMVKHRTLFPLRPQFIHKLASLFLFLSPTLFLQNFRRYYTISTHTELASVNKLWLERFCFRAWLWFLHLFSVFLHYSTHNAFIHTTFLFLYFFYSLSKVLYVPYHIVSSILFRIKSHHNISS